MVIWRRAQMVLLSAQGMPVVKIAEVTFTSDDRVRDVIHNFNADGFDSLYPKYKGGRPGTFTRHCRSRVPALVLPPGQRDRHAPPGTAPRRRATSQQGKHCLMLH